MDKEEKIKKRIINLKAKIEKGEELTRNENLFYLMHVIGHSPSYAQVILSIAENKNPDILMD
jgi:hypothetical protein